MRKIYLDHSATTPLDDAVLEAMTPFFSNIYGNASSQHSFGRDALRAVERAREQVAAAIGAQPSEIYFTSGGTESDNWAIKGAAHSYRNIGKHLITSAIEHPAVLNSMKALEKEGYEVSYLPVDNTGRINLDTLQSVIRKDTILVSVMAANNEIGTLQDINGIAKICRENKIVFHTDAVQAVGSIDINVTESGIDMLSLSAHKFYGPKGVGCLYKSNKVKLAGFMSGGGQERSLRAGTVNTAGAVGLGAAIEIAVRDISVNNAHLSGLRNRFISQVMKRIDNVTLNGGTDHRLSGNANLSFEFIEGESILMNLDIAGIAVSSGSACSSGSLEPSHVLLAIGVPIELAHGSIRFSFGKNNTSDDVDYTVDKLCETVAKLRELSPLIKTKGEYSYV